MQRNNSTSDVEIANFIKENRSNPVILATFAKEIPKLLTRSKEASLIFLESKLLTAIIKPAVWKKIIEMHAQQNEDYWYSVQKRKNDNPVLDKILAGWQPGQKIESEIPAIVIQFFKIAKESPDKIYDFIYDNRKNSDFLVFCKNKSFATLLLLKKDPKLVATFLRSASLMNLVSVEHWKAIIKGHLNKKGFIDILDALQTQYVHMKPFEELIQAAKKQGEKKDEEHDVEDAFNRRADYQNTFMMNQADEKKAAEKEEKMQDKIRELVNKGINLYELAGVDKNESPKQIIAKCHKQLIAEGSQLDKTKRELLELARDIIGNKDYKMNYDEQWAHRGQQASP